MRKLLTTVIALVVLLVVADRVAPAVAAGALAKRIRTEASLSSDPQVTFGGFPFLTQAVAGRYDDVRVRAEGLDVGSVHGITLNTDLVGVHLPLSDVISQRIGTVPVDRVTGTASVSYPDLVRAAELPSGLRIVSVDQDGDGLKVRATVGVLGQPLSATARGSVRVDQGALVITTTRVALSALPAGVPSPTGLAGRLSFRVPLDGLPFGLRVTGVHVDANGLSVSARASHVVLNAGHPGA